MRCPFIQTIVLALLFVCESAHGQAVQQSVSVTDCRRLLGTGDYEACLAAATSAIERRAYGEDWPILKLRAEGELGRYEEALASALSGIERYPWSVRIHLEAYRIQKELGHAEAASRSLQEIDNLAGASPWRYSDADDLVALGHAALAAGADPKNVLEGFFDQARRNFASRPDGFLASAELAIDKGDWPLAVEILNPAVEQFSDDAEILFAHSQAIRRSSPKAAEASFEAALSINPNLTNALLFEASRSIDLERFDEAVDALHELLQRNAHHAEAGALLAAVHHLRNQSGAADRVRAAALAHNSNNPLVDHRIGATLSRRYRFAEGAAFQKQALEADPGYVPEPVASPSSDNPPR